MRDQRAESTRRIDLLSVGPSGPIEQPAGVPLDSRKDDGTIWRYTWSLPGRLVMEFIGTGMVSVTDSGLVTFDRSVNAELEEHILCDHILPLFLARRGLLVLHGALVSWKGRGMVLVGPSGAGKSTLAGFLWQQSWTIGNDDGVVVGSPVEGGDGLCVATPTYPMIRLTASSVDLLGIDVVDGPLVVGKARFVGNAARPLDATPVDLSWVVFLEPDNRAVTDNGIQEVSTLTVLSGVDAYVRLVGAAFHPDFSLGHFATLNDQVALLAKTTQIGFLRVRRGLTGLAEAEAELKKLVTR